MAKKERKNLLEHALENTDTMSSEVLNAFIPPRRPKKADVSTSTGQGVKAILN